MKKTSRGTQNKLLMVLSLGLISCSVFYGPRIINAVHLWAGLALYSASIGVPGLLAYRLVEHRRYIESLQFRLQNAGVDLEVDELKALPLLTQSELNRALAPLEGADTSDVDFQVVQSLFTNRDER